MCNRNHGYVPRTRPEKSRPDDRHPRMGSGHRTWAGSLRGRPVPGREFLLCGFRQGSKLHQRRKLRRWRCLRLTANQAPVMNRAAVLAAARFSTNTRSVRALIPEQASRAPPPRGRSASEEDNTVLTNILQPTHLIIVLIVALLILGPKRLPEAGRALGQGIKEFRGCTAPATTTPRMRSSHSFHPET